MIMSQPTKPASPQPAPKKPTTTENGKEPSAYTVSSRTQEQSTKMATYATPELNDYVWLCEQLEQYLKEGGITQQQINAYVLAQLFSDKENHSDEQ